MNGVTTRWRVISSYKDGDRVVEADYLHSRDRADLVKQLIQNFRQDQDEAPIITVEQQ